MCSERGARRRRPWRQWRWEEVQRRWLVAGVLLAVLLAVLAPRLGAPGGGRCMWRMASKTTGSIGRPALVLSHISGIGPLCTQYTKYLALGYIYFAAGRGARRAPARLLAVACAHASLLAPALCAALLVAAPTAEPRALLHGVLAAAAGGGCSWLSLAVCADGAAPAVTALNYVGSLLATPLATLALCGRAGVPTLVGAAPSLAAAVPAFGAGTLWARLGGAGGAGADVTARGCALALLYVQCCEALATRGSVRPSDMFVVIVLEASWLGLSAGMCWCYARSGLLSAADARVVALCAVPKAADAEWAWTRCAPSALARLPGVLLPPAQALLLAAIAAPPQEAACRRSPAPGPGPHATDDHFDT